MAVAGFTGTQLGMSKAQIRSLRELLVHKNVTKLHHGDCVGADAQAHDVACHLLGKSLMVVIHPPNVDAKRAFCTREHDFVVLQPKPYIERNHDIVKSCDFLIVAPRTETEQLRSGTWATYRFAKKRGVPVCLINPHTGEVTNG